MLFLSQTSARTITDTTVDSNEAVIGGGGIYNFATITVTGSTLSNNQANVNGVLPPTAI